MPTVLKSVVDAVAKRYADIDAAMRRGKLDLPRALSSYAHVVKDNGLSLASFDAADPDEADDAAGSIPFVISSYQEDRDGDVVVPQGCRLENFAKNPVCFFGHQSWEVPIGRCKSPDGEITVYPEKNLIRATIYFDRADPDADLIYGKVKRGFLNSTSIAFVPIKAVRREDVEKARTRNQPMMPPGWLFSEYDLTEVSVVGVPSNQDANVMRDILDTEKQHMTPRLRKAWTPYAAKARGRCFSGWCSGPGCKTRSVKMPTKARTPAADWLGGKLPGLGTIHDVNQSDKLITVQPQDSSYTRRCQQLAQEAESKFPGWDVLVRDPGRSDKSLKKACCDECKSGRACGCAKGKKKSVQADMEPQNQQPGARTGNQRQSPVVAKPFAGYKDMDDCIAKNGDKGDPAAYCATIMRNVEGKGMKKDMGETDGTAGGYLIEPGGAVQANDRGSGDGLSDTSTPGYIRCENCFESPGSCPACDGKGTVTADDGEGKDCDVCGGDGQCTDCDGVGQVPKPEKQAKAPPVKKQSPPTATAVQPITPVDPGQDNLAKLYAHAKAELDFLDAQPDEQKATLAEYRDQVGNRMETLKATFGQQFPDADFDKALQKAMETDGSADTTEPGEAGMVENGDIPPETQQPKKPVTPPASNANGTKGATMARRKAATKDTVQPGTAAVIAAPSMDDDEQPSTESAGGAPYNKGAKDATGTADDVLEGDAPYNNASQPQEKATPFAGQETPQEEDMEDAIMGKDTTGAGDPVSQGGGYGVRDKNGMDGAMMPPCPGCGSPGTGKPFCGDCGSPADGGATKDSTGAGDPVLAGAAGDQPYNKEGAPMPGNDVGAGPDSDADTQEILQRYQGPGKKGWETRKWNIPNDLLPYIRVRTTKDGEMYMVQVKDGNPFAPGDDDETKSDVTPSTGEIIVGSGTVKGMLARVEEVKDHLAAVCKAGDIPVHHKAGFKHGWTQLAGVSKALTDMGKVQADGGKGSALSDKGKIQANSGGGGSALTETGMSGITSTAKGRVRGGVDAVAPRGGVDPAVKREWEATKRLFQQMTGISLVATNN